MSGSDPNDGAVLSWTVIVADADAPLSVEQFTVVSPRPYGCGCESKSPVPETPPSQVVNAAGSATATWYVAVAPPGAVASTGEPPLNVTVIAAGSAGTAATSTSPT